MPENFQTQKNYTKKNEISEAMEDYLEMICRMSEDVVRIGVLASRLDVTPSAASKMAENLREAGFIHFARYGFITLTEKGKKYGNFLLRRHETVHRLLCAVNGGGSHLEETEKIEHYLSEQTVANIEKFLENLEKGKFFAD